MSILELFDLTPTQRQAATARGQDVSVAAGAGSGKTRTLVARYLSFLEEGHLPRSVAAVTFAEKAAREMRNRIRANVHAWLARGCPADERPRWEEIEADIDAARIGTIHGLCAVILRAHPAEARVDPEFEVLDEGLAAALRARAVEEALTWASGEAELVPLFAEFTTGDLVDIVSKLLGARLDTRAALDVPDPSKVWDAALKSAISRFTHDDRVESAIAELRNLKASRKLLDDAGEKLAPQVEGLLAQWGVLEEALTRDKCIEAAQALFIVRREHLGGRSGGRGSRARAAVKGLRELYDETVDPWLGGGSANDPTPDPELESRAAGLTPLIGKLFEHALAGYQNAKDLRQALDFDDLEAKALELLNRADIRARWQGQIDALLVDEFQDTNERQRQIVEALAGVAEGMRGRLFVVGDGKQSIYRFRGADVTVFRRLDRDIRSRGGLPLDLDLTFRAHKPLVLALNEILQTVMAQADPARPYAVPFAELRAHRETPRDGIAEPHVEFLCGLGERAEDARPAAARLLAQRLLNLHRQEGVRWEDVALLFRASTGFRDYEDALETAGIPFVTVAGRGFYDRPEVRDLLNLLRALADPWGDAALAGLLRSPAFGLSDAALYLLRWPDGGTEPMSFRQALVGNLSHLSEVDRRQAQRAREMLDRLAGLVDRVHVAELLKRVMDETLYPAVLATAPPGERLQRNVDKLLADAHASGLVRVTEFLEYVETLQAAGAREGEAPAEAGGAVRLMTVHKAKGLEFPVVVIADASRRSPGTSDAVLLSPEIGLAPRPGRWEQAPLIYRLAKLEENDRGEAEDLRLQYVAATRAQEKLIVCGHQVPTSADVWLTKLASAAGLDLDHLAEKPGAPQTVTLPRSGQVVRGLAQPADAVTLETAEAEPTAKSDKAGGVPLYKPVSTQAVEAVDAKVTDKEGETWPMRHVTGRARHPDGTIVGRLVHEAIRRWRFPGDAGFEHLLHAAARQVGLVDAAEIDRHVRQATELLGRLKADPRWAEIDTSERRHEVPYSMPVAGRISAGFVDLLYRGVGGRWKVVDFKTDSVADEADVKRLIVEGYQEQMLRYRDAVRALIGQEVAAALCFLDYAGVVRWEPL